LSHRAFEPKTLAIHVKNQLFHIIPQELSSYRLCQNSCGLKFYVNAVVGQGSDQSDSRLSWKKEVALIYLKTLRLAFS